MSQLLTCAFLEVDDSNAYDEPRWDDSAVMDKTNDITLYGPERR